MNTKEVVLTLCLGLEAVAAHAGDEAGSLVYFGSRSAPQVATGTQGIYAARFDPRTGKLAPLGLQVEVTYVSWLLPHPSLPILFMVSNPDSSNTVESKVHSYVVDQASGKLREISQVGSGGRDTTYLAIDAASQTLFGASFASGEVMSLEVLPDGSLGQVASSQKHFGNGPSPRQETPHAHAVAVDPTRRYVLSPDLGADRIFIHRFDAATRTLTAAQPPFEPVPPGAGPRHVVFHPNGKFLYLNTEITAEVRVYRWDAKRGRLHLVEALPVYPAGYAGGVKSSSEIGISRDGRHLYVSLRGDQNSIVAYDVNANTGRLTQIQRIASQGKSPRSFGIDPTGRWLLVIHDVSGMVNVFSIDQAGKLSPTDESLPIPNAASIAFFAQAKP